MGRGKGQGMNVKQRQNKEKGLSMMDRFDGSRRKGKKPRRNTRG